MLELRAVESSLYYFLKDKLDESGWGSEGYYNNHVVTLRDDYPNDEELNKIVATATGMADSEIVLPVVVIEMTEQNEAAYQLGSKPANTRSFVVSILGREKAEAKDISQQIYEWFQDNNVDLNNYNEGFPPNVYPNKVGTIEIDNVRLVPVRIIGSPDISDRHRYEVMFTATSYLTGTSEEDLPL